MKKSPLAGKISRQLAISLIKYPQFWLILFVRQTAGRSFAEDKSSNGNGTRTILPFSIKRFSIFCRINVLIRFFQKSEYRVFTRCNLPIPFRDIIVLGKEDNYPDIFFAEISTGSSRIIRFLLSIVPVVSMALIA